MHNYDRIIVLFDSLRLVNYIYGRIMKKIVQREHEVSVLREKFKG